ncbi:hypothetical protein, partial [Piscinibacter sp.]|uniref:hypothetical protein n=1 Tax=Piscinibacter sp. TaxID=1903157 RepID=UPI002BFF1693
SSTVKVHGVAFQALCFGDFHLGQQMKVTRPPGRDPACNTNKSTCSEALHQWTPAFAGVTGYCGVTARGDGAG